MNMKEQIHTLSEEMIANLGRLVAIDSQLGTPEEGKPFGAGPAKALEEGLKIAEELGFKTVNLDHYCGYAEMGEGEEIVGIACTDQLHELTNKMANSTSAPLYIMISNSMSNSLQDAFEQLIKTGSSAMWKHTLNLFNQYHERMK